MSHDRRVGFAITTDGSKPDRIFVEGVNSPCPAPGCGFLIPHGLEELHATTHEEETA